MEILTRRELSKRYPEILRKMGEGAVFIHPTDTIYGLGCDAFNERSVQRIRSLKQQFHQPMSVWVPSREWIRKNCIVEKKAEVWLKKLPGPYTLILPLKNLQSVAPSVILHQNTIGIRLPEHWFGKLVAELGFPIVTTSANITGKPFMTSLETLDKDIEKGVEFMVYEGVKDARPSIIIDGVEGKVKER